MNVKSAARKPIQASATILVASDNTGDAALIRKMLESEFDRVFVSTNPDLAVKDFESRAPDVLVLAFDTLEESERHYLGLYRLSSKIHLQPHRTVILCNKDEVSRAYQACRKEHFYDYILFWPMTNDAPRLLMAVHHALRDLAAVTQAGPSAAEFAIQARRLAELESVLEQQMAQGIQRIDVANRAMVQAEQDIGTALDGFSRKLAQGALPGLSTPNHVANLELEIKRFKHQEVGPLFRVAAESVHPIKRWTDEFMKECTSHIETARTLKSMAACIQPTILIVDDDDFQRKIVSELLAAENYRLVFAAGGVEALNILLKLQPDLVIMDIMMPDLDGIETTRRLKTMPRLANVPVIMVTGKSERDSVHGSMKAGASGFVVKPLDRDTLLAKVARALRP